MPDDIKPATSKKTTRELLAPIRRLAYILIGLLIFWAVFGELLPKLLFPPKTEVAAPIKQEAAPAIDPLQERLGKAEARIAELEEAVKRPVIASVDTSALDAEIGDLQKKVEALQQKPDGTLAMHHLSLLTVFGQIKDAIARSEPFEAAHAQLTKLSEARPKTLELLVSLKPYATEAAPSLAHLQREFQVALDKALASSADKHSLGGNLHSLIRIRKVGEPSGNDDRSILARAESKLKRGEVEAAAAELSHLPKNTAQAFAGWLLAAEHYVKLRLLMDSLQLDLSQPNAMLPLRPLPTVDKSE